MTDALPIILVGGSLPDESIGWGSPAEIERRRRIRVSLWAYAYEKLDLTLVPDHVYDLEASLIDVNEDTGHPLMDAFFKDHFSPITGMWINQHPQLDQLHHFGRRLKLWK